MNLSMMGDYGCVLTFPLGTTAVWIHIRLDETDVTLYNRADVFYPVFGTLLVSFDGTASESARDQNWLRLPRTKATSHNRNVRCNIFVNHRTLVLVGDIFSRLDRIIETSEDKDRHESAYLGESFHHTRQRLRKVTISDG